MNMRNRVGHHSTSDDSSAYRSKTEVSSWQSKDSPSTRFRKYLESKGWWSPEEESEFKKRTRQEILRAFSQAEKVKKPGVRELFTDVYDEPPKELLKQERELQAMMRKYPQFYDASGHVSS
jgi:2-oxoisovalerate dehydrogenase E1 component alpha subunit